MANIINDLTSLVTSDLISKAANSLGESEGGISKAIGGLLPTLLGGMVDKSSDSNAMGNIFNLLSDGRNLGFLDNLGGLIGGGNANQGIASSMTSSLTSALFGNKMGGILDAISSFAGVSKNSSSSLLNLATPLIMGFLGKKIKNQGLDVGGLVSMLMGQKSNIMSALPAGVASMAGLANLGQTAEPVKPTGSKGGGWWKWLLPLLAIGAVIYFMRDCNRPAVMDQAKNAVEQAGDAVSDVAKDAADAAQDAAEATKGAVASLGDFFSRKLACGIELNIPENGIETQVVDFIEDEGRPTDKTTWFNFDRLTFKTGSANLDMAKSEEQLKNIAEIMKCYKGVAVKLGGYTDNTGNPDSNMKLSQARANSVKAALVGLGVDAGRMETEGYGVQHPIASNDTEEGRAQNRRIALRVMAK